MKTNNNIPAYRFQGYTDAWELRKLGELAEIVRGASPRPIQDPKWFDEQSEIGWLRISDVTEQDGRIYHLEQKISKLGQQKTRVLVEPHLLLSIAATVGKPVVNYVKTGVHDGFLIFLEPRFEQEFMFQWLEMFRSSWSKYGQPGSQVNLNSDLVKNQELSIPTLPEQEAIGTFFSTLDQQITLHQRKLDTLKEQKKTYLKLLFPAKGQTKPALRFQGFEDDWEVKRISDIGDIVTGNTPSTSNEDYYSNEGMMWVTPTDIDGLIITDTNKKLSPEGEKVSRIVPANSILVTCIASIGKNTLLLEAGSFNQQINAVVPNQSLYHSYFLLTQSYFWSESMKRIAPAATMQIINKN
ncbi:TPA: restriction endonuclease subunit S, partial [Streptococcus suis]